MVGDGCFQDFTGQGRNIKGWAALNACYSRGLGRKSNGFLNRRSHVRFMPGALLKCLQNKGFPLFCRCFCIHQLFGDYRQCTAVSDISRGRGGAELADLSESADLGFVIPLIYWWFFSETKRCVEVS